MEPFMIYDTNLSYKQYEEIVNFLNEKIIEYKNGFATNSKKFLQIYSKLVTKETKVNNTSIMFNLLSNDQMISEQVFKAYNISQENKNVTSIELLDKIIRIDNEKLFM
jgi:DNA-binding ferritin-like protein